MKYPGNENLAEEIRERILNTFRHTLELAEKGDQREAQLGCDFVLRLDPLFEPARELGERLEGSDGATSVNDLRESIGEPAPPAPAVEPIQSPAERTPERPKEPELAGIDPVLPPASGPDTSSLELDSALDLSSLGSEPAEPASAPAAPQPEPTKPEPAEPEPAPDPPAPTPSAPPPPPPEASSHDAEPVAALDNESEQRVQDLLNEGQVAFDEAEYQSAIDSWSRIFLIDIDHPEANRRIDLARKLKAEVERKVEETFHDALTKIETGRLDEARDGFEKVLEVMPGHIAAQEYLDKLNAPDFVPPETTGVKRIELATEGEFDETESASAGEGDALFQEPDTLPVSAAAQPLPSISGVGRASKPARTANTTFRNIGVGALLLLAVVGWLVYRNWDKFFPNAADVKAQVQLDPVTRAKRTYAEAGAAIAIAQLRRLSPGHPQYDEAQALVAQWEASLDASKPKTSAPEPEAVAARDRFVEAGLEAFGKNEFLSARELFERAATQAPLDSGTEEILEQARDQLEPLRAEIAMFDEGEWQMALRNLWRIWEGGDKSPDVRRLMVDSYYNLGVRDLQRQDAAEALDSFNEARDLSGEDPELERLIEFADVYQERNEDLLYRIFVKYLPFR